MSDIGSTLEQYMQQRLWADASDVAALLDHVPDGLVLTDPSSTILWANASYCRMTGYTLQQLQGETPRLLRGRSTRTSNIEALWESLNASGRAETRVVDVRADGSELHGWLSVVQVELAPPLSLAYLGILRDISLEVADRSRLHALADEAARARDVTILAMATLAEERDGTTGRHLQRVESYCLSMARWLANEHPDALPPQARDPELVARCATLHDIGKVGIPDAILSKPGRLTTEEEETMRTHPIIGAEILERVLEHQPDSRFLQLARDVVLCHHEAYDGSGYPFGLAGDDIPIVAQLTTVADVLDALTSDRPYKAAHSLAESMAWIDARRGSLFSPLAVDALRAVEDEIAHAHARLRDDRRTSSRPIAGRQIGASAGGGSPAISPSLAETRHSTRPDVAPRDGLEAVLRAVTSAGLTGEVRVPHGAHQARVDIADGAVLWVDAAGSDPTLQRRLVQTGVVTSDQLQQAIADCRRTGQRLVSVLLSSLGIPPEDLRAVVLRHVADKLEALLQSSESRGATFMTRPCVRTSFAFTLEEVLGATRRTTERKSDGTGDDDDDRDA